MLSRWWCGCAARVMPKLSIKNSLLASGCAVLADAEPAPLMQLREEVCSTGGLTIAGVNVLDRAGLSGLIVEAVVAAQKRGREMES